MGCGSSVEKNGEGKGLHPTGSPGISGANKKHLDGVGSFRKQPGARNDDAGRGAGLLYTDIEKSGCKTAYDKSVRPLRSSLRTVVENDPAADKTGSGKLRALRAAQSAGNSAANRRRSSSAIVTLGVMMPHESSPLSRRSSRRSVQFPDMVRPGLAPESPLGEPFAAGSGAGGAVGAPGSSPPPKHKAQRPHSPPPEPTTIATDDVADEIDSGGGGGNGDSFDADENQGNDAGPLPGGSNAVAIPDGPGLQEGNGAREGDPLREPPMPYLVVDSEDSSAGAPSSPPFSSPTS